MNIRWYLVCIITIILSGCVSTGQFKSLEDQIDQNTAVITKVINAQSAEIVKLKQAGMYNMAVLNCYTAQEDPSPAAKDKCIEQILEEMKKSNNGGAQNEEARKDDLPGLPGQEIQGATAGSSASGK